ncbi:MAG: hypothetical protein ACREYA_07125 [Cupriavidus necator]
MRPTAQGRLLPVAVDFRVTAAAAIDAGDIPLHQQVGNQRRILKSAVLAWHRRERARRRKALGQLGTHLDHEISAG